MFVVVKGVTMSSVLLVKTATLYLLGHVQSQIVIDSGIAPQDLCDKDRC